jgi:hypothetical protein
MGSSWDFMGFSWGFIGGMSPTMCVFVSLQGIQQGLPHPMGRSYRGYTPSSHAPSITVSTIYTSYLYIYNIIYIYIPSYKSPFLSWCRGSHGFKATPIWKNTRIMSSAFRVFACASAQRAVKAACIGRIWRVLPCFPRRPSSVQQIV